MGHLVWKSYPQTDGAIWSSACTGCRPRAYSLCIRGFKLRHYRLTGLSVRRNRDIPGRGMWRFLQRPGNRLVDRGAYCQFLSISHGSAREASYVLTLCARLGYLAESSTAPLANDYDRAAAMLPGIINSLQ